MTPEERAWREMVEQRTAEDRLQAAAPDLLAAAKNLHTVYQPTGWFFDAEAKEAWDALVAAIAKAEGGDAA